MFNMPNANSYMQMAMMNPQFAVAFQQQQQQTSTAGGGAAFANGQVGYNYPPGYYQQPQQYITPIKPNEMNNANANKGSASGKTNGTRTSRKRKTDAERAARVCVNCQCTDSPFWRKEKNGEGSLCNACGLYFAKNNAPRPVGLWKRERNANTLVLKQQRLQQQQELAAQKQQQRNGERGAPSTSPNNHTSEEEGGYQQQQNDSGSGRQNQKTASNEAGSDGAKTESVEKANQSGGNSSDENNEKKGGGSEENTDDDENENENKLEWKRAKVVLETTGERILVRVSESVERGGSNERERERVKKSE